MAVGTQIGDNRVVDISDKADLSPSRRAGSPHASLPNGSLAQARLWQLAVKRSIDVIGSLLGLVVLSPVLLITALLVPLSSPGPALYFQERVGRGGRFFKVIKFRSMYRNAHDRKGQLGEMNHCSGPIFKIRSDPRVTPLGRLIRRLCIDELPQLINVLLGQMSLVGPRPALPEEYETYSPRERERLLVKPGLTCVWQVSGRSDLDFETWIEMDLQYIHHWNLRQDIQMLLLTIPAVASGRGAY